MRNEDKFPPRNQILLLFSPVDWPRQSCPSEAATGDGDSRSSMRRILRASHREVAPRHWTDTRQLVPLQPCSDTARDTEVLPGSSSIGTASVRQLSGKLDVGNEISSQGQSLPFHSGHRGGWQLPRARSSRGSPGWQGQVLQPWPSPPARAAPALSTSLGEARMSAHGNAWLGRAGLQGAGGQERWPQGAEIAFWAVGRVGGSPGELHRAITAHHSPQGQGSQSCTLLGSTGTLLSYCLL